MSGGIPSNVPGYLPPSIPLLLRQPSTGHLSALCKRREGLEERRCLIGLLHRFYLLLFCCLSDSGSIYLVF